MGKKRQREEGSREGACMRGVKMGASDFFLSSLRRKEEGLGRRRRLYLVSGQVMLMRTGNDDKVRQHVKAKKKKKQGLVSRSK